jgi:dihydrofolate reductase
MSAMRKLVIFDHVTADGYFATRDGTLDWVVPEDAAPEHAMKRTGEITTVLFGRKTYDMFAEFWPAAYEKTRRGQVPDDPHQPGVSSEHAGTIAKFLNDVEKVVYSRTLTDPTWNNTRVVRELDRRDIEALKRGPGGGIMIFGSASIVSTLSKHGLIDEYQLVVSPVVLGAGRKLIDNADRRGVTLAETKQFDSGVVLLRYTAR